MRVHFVERSDVGAGGRGYVVRRYHYTGRRERRASSRLSSRSSREDPSIRQYVQERGGALRHNVHSTVRIRVFSSSIFNAKAAAGLAMQDLMHHQDPEAGDMPRQFPSTLRVRMEPSLLL